MGFGIRGLDMSRYSSVWVILLGEFEGFVVWVFFVGGVKGVNDRIDILGFYGIGVVICLKVIMPNEKKNLYTERIFVSILTVRYAAIIIPAYILCAHGSRL